MQKDKASNSYRTEPRWPVMLSLLFVCLVLGNLPARIRLIPTWLSFTVVILLALPMLAVSVSSANNRWLKIEKFTTLAFAVFAEAFTLIGLFYLIREMVRHPENLDGVVLLTSSVSGWIMNILSFSLVYWRIDRGGPEARMNKTGKKPDWLFPQTGVPDDVPEGWRPNYIDYLFLAFSTATAFSTTEVAPLTSRAKVLMMMESSVSLMMLVIVASRAINILGT